jgi:hypothetical protein
MKYALAALGLATAAYAQGVTEDIKPKASAPDGCEATYDGKFEISVRSFAKRGLEVSLLLPCSGLFLHMAYIIYSHTNLEARMLR